MTNESLEKSAYKGLIGFILLSLLGLASVGFIVLQIIKYLMTYKWW